MFARRPLAALLLIVSFVHACRSAEAGKLSAAVQPFVDKHELAGAVMLVADKDKVLALESAGYADVAARKEMPANALFWIASQSKPITATALMLLVDEGKVNVDDPVEKYLPEFKGQKVKIGTAEPVDPVHPITVKNILSHTSGLPFSSAMEKPTLDLFPLSERVKSYAAAPLIFQPDSKYQYANAGINTAARIIEVVSGMPYEKFMDERIFKPLGMSDTTFWPSDEQVARLAKSYKPNAAKNDLEECPVTQLHYPLTDHTVRFPMPAGGLFSTAHDLSQFYRMLLNGGQLDGKRILSEASLKQMTSRQTPAALKDNYALRLLRHAEQHRAYGGAYSTGLAYPTFPHGLILITGWKLQPRGLPRQGWRIEKRIQQNGVGGVRSAEVSIACFVGGADIPVCQLRSTV